MIYKFTELEPGTYLVEDHTIIKNTNGQWQATPPIENEKLQKAFLEFTKELKDV